VVSEERGEVSLNGGGEDGSVRVVLDPVDGSMNAKRALPFACVSIAVASGSRMRDVEVGYVAELDPPRDWWAVRGEGAFLGRVRHETADMTPQRDEPQGAERLAPLRPGPLEVLGLETARPALVAGAAEAIAGVEARRLRVLGSVAASMCLVAAGRLDAMITLREVRSVDVAAAQLIVEEAGGAVALPGGDALDLALRTRAAAARDASMLERLRTALL
jgi:myo-inositol-1(or 4)-monophosphatase